MKKALLTVFALCAMGVASAASVKSIEKPANPYLPFDSKSKHLGLYLGAAAGYSSSAGTHNLFQHDASITQAQHHASARADAGYLLPITNTLFLGVEAGYNALPDSQYASQMLPASAAALSNQTDGMVKYSRYSLDALGVIKSYLTQDFAVFIKGGEAYVSQEVTQTITSPSTHGAYFSKELDKHQKLQPKVAGGFGYQVNSKLELTTEYDHTFGDEMNAANGADLFGSNVGSGALVDGSRIPSNDTVLMGLSYHF